MSDSLISGKCLCIAKSARSFTSSHCCLEAKYSKVPTLKWLLATRVRIPPGSKESLATYSPVATAAKALDVGMPK